MQHIQARWRDTILHFALIVPFSMVYCWVWLSKQNPLLFLVGIGIPFLALAYVVHHLRAIHVYLAITIVVWIVSRNQKACSSRPAGKDRPKDGRGSRRPRYGSYPSDPWA